MSPGPALDDRILDLLDAPGGLDALVPDLFAHQQRHCPPYRAFCARRGVTEVAHWRQIPPLSVEAFADVALRGFEHADVVARFSTSGTTRGVDRRGHHDFDTLRLYRAASMRSFGHALVPEGGRLPVVSLIPRESDSSLSQMVDWVIEDFASDVVALDAVTAPSLVLGTAFGLATAFDERPDLRLPAGSRIMETGGFKGRRREVTRRALHGLYHRAGVPSSHVVGEYGMTELSSQWYDGIAGTADDDVDARVYRPAPWARTAVIDPVRLEDVAEGETGLLLHFDPVNRGSVSALLTSDLGIRRGDGFTFVGRAAGAAIRGCSLRSE